MNIMNNNFFAEDTQAGPIDLATPYAWVEPKKLPIRPRIYGDQLLRSTASFIVGPGATGKTALSIGMALSMVTGRDLLGSKVWGGPKKIWLWNLEDSLEELSRSFQAAAKHWGITSEDLVDRLFVNSALDGHDLKIASSGQNGTEIDFDKLDAISHSIRAHKIDVLFVDPFVSCHGLNENDNMAMDMVVKAWAKIASEVNCSVVLVHHTGKGQSDNEVDSVRGASSIIAAARSVVMIRRMTKKEAKDFGIDDESYNRYFRLYDYKNNRAPPADAPTWLTMISVSLDNGDNDYVDSDHVGVMVPADISKIKLPDMEVDSDMIYKIQTELDDNITYRYDPQSKNWIGLHIIGYLGDSWDIKVHKKRLQDLVDMWVGKEYFKMYEQAIGGTKRQCVMVGMYCK